MPRLSICIATRDRKAFIVDLIATIAHQIEKYCDVNDVEVVVVDGGSSDGSKRAIAQMGLEYGWLVSILQDYAGGIDHDFNRAISASTGNYCWLLSDDDRLEATAIPEVLSVLDRSRDLFIINASIWDRSFKNQLKPLAIRLEKDAFFGEDSHEALFIKTAGYLSFIGAVVVRRSLWNSRDAEQYFGSWFAHVGLIFETPLPRGAEVLNKPLIKIRYGDASWSPNAFRISMVHWPNLIWRLKFPSQVKSRVVKRYPWRSLGQLIMLRSKSLLTHEAVAELRNIDVFDYLDELKVRMICCLPQRLLNKLLQFAIILFQRNQPNRLINLYDLKNNGAKEH